MLASKGRLQDTVDFLLTIWDCNHTLIHPVPGPVQSRSPSTLLQNGYKVAFQHFYTQSNGYLDDVEQFQPPERCNLTKINPHNVCRQLRRSLGFSVTDELQERTFC